MGWVVSCCIVLGWVGLGIMNHRWCHLAPATLVSSQEDAANDLLRDANKMSREEAACGSCHSLQADVLFATLTLCCRHRTLSTL